MPRLADDVDATRRVRMAKRLKRGHMVNESGKREAFAPEQVVKALLIW